MTNKERLVQWVRLRGMHTVLWALAQIADENAERIKEDNALPYATTARLFTHWESIGRALGRMSVDVKREQELIGKGEWRRQ